MARQNRKALYGLLWGFREAGMNGYITKSFKRLLLGCTVLDKMTNARLTFAAGASSSAQGGGLALTRKELGVDAYVGKQIRQRRIRSGMTLTQLADRLGVTYQQVQKYETGSNRVAASRLAEIANVFEVPVASFFPAATVTEAPPEPGNIDLDYAAAAQGLNEAAATLLRAARGKGAIRVEKVLKPLVDATLFVAEIEARPEDTELLVALHSWAVKAKTRPVRARAK